MRMGGESTVSHQDSTADGEAHATIMAQQSDYNAGTPSPMITGGPFYMEIECASRDERSMSLISVSSVNTDGSVLSGKFWVIVAWVWGAKFTCDSPTHGLWPEMDKAM